MTISSGGKYLAILNKNGERILIYDLTTGMAVGEAVIQKEGFFVPGCQGLAFSSDGKSLAGMFTVVATPQITVWDATTGKVKLTHKFPQGLATAFGYRGAPLEWLSDGSGWFVNGSQFVDAEKGVIFWKLPPPPPGDTLPRRQFGMKHVAQVKGDFRAKTLIVDALPSDQVAAAQRAIRNGEDPTATKLPPIKAADWSAVRSLPAPGAGGDWKAAIDPAPARKPLVKSVPLQGKGADFALILFAPDAAQAAVLSASAPSEVVVQKQVRADRYDLLAGKNLGSLDLFSAEPPQGQQLKIDAAFSPDGALIAVKEPKDGKRVDVWSLADKKHFVGWLPCEKEADAGVRWIGFLDAKRLLTLGAAGKLVLWDLPECKAVWAQDGCRGVPIISPGRKYFAIYTGTAIEMLTAAGDRVGGFTGPVFTNVWAAAFKPDGKEFAAAVQKQDGGTVLLRWNAADGVPIDEFPIAMISNDIYHNELKWCGPDHLMNQNQLIDLNLKWVTFSYNIPGGGGKHATGTPDGRHWFTFAGQANAPAVLMAQSFPDAVSKTLAADVAAKRVQPVLSPGMTISVRVEGAGPPGDADFHKRITENIKQSLGKHGLKVADQGQAALVISFQPEQQHRREDPV